MGIDTSVDWRCVCHRYLLLLYFNTPDGRGVYPAISSNFQQLSEEMEEYGELSNAIAESFDALFSGEYNRIVVLPESADAISSMSLGYGEDDTVEYGWSILLG